MPQKKLKSRWESCVFPPPHPCASAIPRFSTLISHSLIMELRMTCRERGTSRQVCVKRQHGTNLNTTHVSLEIGTTFKLKFKCHCVGLLALGWGVGRVICSLWRDGFRIGCRHLIVSHARKTLARSRAAGICDEGSRTRV